ncbi:MAG: hypothetical protein ACOVQT_11440 [Rubrivivax sp.]
MMPLHRLLAAGLLGALGTQVSAQDWPDWILNPPSGPELHAGDCVESSGSVGIDRQQATARARLALAQQIEVRVEAMDQTWESRFREGQAQQLASRFVSASKQIVATTLQGARPVRTEVVKSRGGHLGCVLVALQREASEQLPGDIIRTAAAPVDAATESMLVARFRQAAVARGQPATRP